LTIDRVRRNRAAAFGRVDAGARPYRPYM
jgi:hypothetical protein